MESAPIQVIEAKYGRNGRYNDKVTMTKTIRAKRNLARRIAIRTGMNITTRIATSVPDRSVSVMTPPPDAANTSVTSEYRLVKKYCVRQLGNPPIRQVLLAFHSRAVQSRQSGRNERRIEKPPDGSLGASRSWFFHGIFFGSATNMDTRYW